MIYNNLMKAPNIKTLNKTPPKDIKELQGRIDNFFKENKPTFTEPISPRWFRIYIGVSKQTLSNWKKSSTKQNMFDLIKTYEDALLAVIEQATLKLSKVNKDHRVNLLGLFNILRAYDTEQYVPEFRKQEEEIEQEKLVINMEHMPIIETGLLEAKEKGAEEDDKE